MRHQVEVEKLCKEDELAMQKERKQKYKEELDQQRLEKATKNSPEKTHNTGTKLSIAVDEGEAFMRKAREHQKLAGSLVLQKMHEDQRKHQEQKETVRAEEGAYLKMVQEQEDAYRRAAAIKQTRKQQMEESLRHSYAEQVREKKRAVELQKNEDKLVVLKELAKPEHNELEIKKVIRDGFHIICLIYMKFSVI